MEVNLKSEFMADVAKLVTKDCSAKCFQQNSTTCTEECYDSYISTLNTTTKVLRNIGYTRNSRYITLAYGEKFDEWDRIKKYNDTSINPLGELPPLKEKYVFDSRKNV
jgi:hypothetical protein